MEVLDENWRSVPLMIHMTSATRLR
jgi:hypothetical protein